MSKRIGLVISDIHVGAIAPNEIWSQMQNSFFSYANKLEQLDFIVIDGDFFDYKLYLNSPHSEVAVRVMTAIYGLAKRFCAKLRIVYGTESHESNQYRIFDNLTKDTSVDFKIINTVCEEQLFDDTKVLYLPEEFVLDKREYYKDFFDKEKEYDYIFGHGVIQEVMTNAVRHSDKKSNRPKPAVFTTAELDNICKGMCFFGHYHIHVDITDNISYVGSFTRWKFGEEPDKGFFMTEKKGDKFKSKFIVNDYADKYVTKSYGYSHAIFTSEDEFIKEMDSVVCQLSYDKNVHIRLLVNIPEDLSWANFIMEYLKSKFSTGEASNRVKINIVNGYIEKKEQADKEQIAEILDKYDFIFNRDLKLEDKCVQFIKLKFGRDIAVERMREILYKEIGT